MAKSHTKTAPTLTKRLPKKAPPAWIAEEEAQETQVDNTPAPTTPAAQPTGERKARKHNEQSYRWVAINVIKDNPGKSQEALIKLMDQVKPGKDGAYWKRRIGRAYKLALQFQVALPARAAVPAAPTKKAGKKDAVEEV